MIATRVKKLKPANSADPDVIVGVFHDMDEPLKIEEHLADALENALGYLVSGNRHALGGTFLPQ